MEFQILNENKKPIKINDLDREVCKLWNVNYNEKSYAVPLERSEFTDGLKGTMSYLKQINWFDDIGWQIANGLSFEDIIENWKIVFKKYLDEGITLHEIFPKRMMLLEHWIEKNYEPKKYNSNEK